MKRIHLFLITLLLLTSVKYMTAQYQTGEKVSDFILRNIDGKMVSLADYKDAKGFILIFTCNHCPFVHKYENRIKALHDVYAPKGFSVVAINSNDDKISPGDSYEEMKKRHRDQNYKFAYLWDQSQELARRFGAERTPHVFVLKKESSALILTYSGTIDNNVDNESKADKHYVSDAVNAILDNRLPSVTETRAVGCTIKWRN